VSLRQLKGHILHESRELGFPNRAVYTDATLSGAMYFVTPLNLPYVLKRLVPQLEAAIDGRAPRRMG
jgi:hypothetical protein